MKDRYLSIDNKLNNLFDSIRNSKVPHAVLLECEDKGKIFDISIKIAKLIICQDINDSDSRSVICKKIENNIHPDVQLVECKEKMNTIGVSEVRKLISDVYIKPNEAFYKVYIIKDSGLFTLQAQNALLKILEEPPKNVVFIMLCESSKLLIPTILSRVQIFSFESENNYKSEDIINIALDLVSSISEKKEFDMLRVTSSLPKDKNNLKKILKQVIEIFNSAIVIKYSSDFECSHKQNALKILESLNMLSIEKIVEVLLWACDLIDMNVNHNLFISCFCSKLRESVVA